MAKSSPLRWAKTLFFLISMTASLLLVCAPPLLVAILDFVLPSALLSAAASNPRLSLYFVFSQLRNFDFSITLVDVPLLSIARSFLILCVYSVWDGKGPYLGIAMASNLISFAYVLFKAVAFYGVASMEITGKSGSREGRLIEALFLSSLALAMAHIVVAYRTNCRERRKLLVYRIDIEAVQIEVTELKMNPPHPM